MLEQKRITRIFAVVAGASMLVLAGPAALADDEPTANPSPAPVAVDEGNGQYGENCVIVVQPERTLKNGKVVPAKTRISNACVQERDRVRAERALQREERTQLREEVRAAGGSWGAVVRQETMVKVATKLAERHLQAPGSAALEQVLTLVNRGLPEALQLDIEAFLDQYELVFADLIVADDEV